MLVIDLFLKRFKILNHRFGYLVLSKGWWLFFTHFLALGFWVDFRKLRPLFFNRNFSILFECFWRSLWSWCFFNRDLNIRFLWRRFHFDRDFLDHWGYNFSFTSHHLKPVAVAFYLETTRLLATLVEKIGTLELKFWSTKVLAIFGLNKDQGLILDLWNIFVSLWSTIHFWKSCKIFIVSMINIFRHLRIRIMVLLLVP